MARHRAFLGSSSRAALVWIWVAALWGCGTVLPPLEESDGATPAEDGGAPRDGADDEDTGPPMDDDGGESDASRDVSTDGGAGEAGVDGCRDCPDVRSEGGARDVGTIDARSADADVRGTDVRGTDGDGSSCPTPANCALAACNGASCGAHGLVCKSSMCACPGGQAKESTCGDSSDNDCDGLIDCADPDCARLQCGASTNQRCCGTACVNTETDPANCQGCGLACAAGQTCKRIVDDAGTRGACTCAGTTSQCPHFPAQVCRVGNNDGQDNVCACDLVGTGNAGCAEGQVCVDVPAANYCRY
jgi:hypothetical protein